MTDESRLGLVVMAYGTPRTPAEIEPYYTHIRRGRPPTPELLAELTARYDAIGGISPLAERTEAQRAAIARALDERMPGRWEVVLGQKHADPFIEDGIADLAAAGVTDAVGLVLAPHYSAFSVGEYQRRAADAGEGRGMRLHAVDRWHLEPAYLDFLAAAVVDARAGLPPDHKVLFTAHSLPERVLVDDPYPDELYASAAAVAERVGLSPWPEWALAWQSAGRTPEPWRGPDILQVIRDLGATGRTAGVLVCAQGFTSDHLEVLYDLDVEASRVASESGLDFARTRSIDDDPAVMGALADLVVARARAAGLGYVDTGTAHVVVVGAGITGLTTAFTLATRHPHVRVTVLEASGRVGGKILTTPFAGRPVDCAADAFLARVPEARDLCVELGMGETLTAPARRSALVWARGRLRPLPSGLVLGVPTDLDALAASGIVSADGVARAARDLEATEAPADEPTGDPEGVGDQSVGQLVRGRLGDEVHEQLVSPLLSGVNAGDADQLSLATGAAQLAGAARRDPSLIRGLRAQQQAALDAGADPAAPVFHGIPVGTQTLTDLLLARLDAAGVPVHLSCPVDAIERAAGGYILRTASGVIGADRIVLCTPAPVAARLLAPLSPGAAAGMAELEYASAAMVALAVPRDQIDHPLDASGFLVGAADPLPVLTACSWASAKWAHLDDPDVALLRASAGRHGNTGALTLTDPELVDAVVADLGTTMGVRGRPREQRVSRWVDALPQFRPGHLARVRGWREAVADDAPGVVLAGAAYDGLGIPACIRQGRRAADEVAAG